MEVKDLIIGKWYRYDDGNEKCVAKILKKEDEEQKVYFIDADEFEWEDFYNDIPIVIKSELI